MVQVCLACLAWPHLRRKCQRCPAEKRGEEDKDQEEEESRSRRQWRKAAGGEKVMVGG